VWEDRCVWELTLFGERSKSTYLVSLETELEEAFYNRVSLETKCV